MKKRTKIIIVLTIIFSVFIGVVLYNQWQYRKEGWGRWMEIKTVEYEKAANYTIIDALEGKMVINENIGLRFAVPKDWQVNIITKENEIEILSPDIDITGMGRETSFPLKGCIIRSGVVYFVQDFLKQEQRPQIISKKIAGNKEIIEETQEIITISNYSALKTLKFKDSDLGRVILVEIPVKNKIYHFGIIFPISEKQRCEKEFNKFFDSVFIM